MKHHSIPMRMALALPAMAALASAMPVHSATNYTTAEISHIRFLFSDASSHVDASSVRTTFSALAVEDFDHVPITLVDESLAGFATATYRAEHALATFSSAATAESISASIDNLSTPAGVTDELGFVDTGISGSFFLSPHSSLTLSADYVASAGLSASSSVSSDEQDAGFTLHTYQYLLRPDTTDSPYREAGSLSRVWANDTSSVQLRSFQFGVGVTTLVYTPTVPEPETWGLSILGLGMTGAGAWRMRRRTAT